MLYKLYCHDVETNVSLENFGIDQTLKSSKDPINLEFYRASPDNYNEYLNHQTHSDESYGYYYVKDIALFEVFSGSKIVIKYFEDIDTDLIHTLLNYPFAILFNQRKSFVIHAAAVLFNKKVFCFCGKTQSGKSSLASHIIKKGGRLISEDTCVFDSSRNTLALLPSYKFLKISDEVNKYNNESFSNPIIFSKKSTKRNGFILDDNKFHSEPIGVNYFIYLDWSHYNSSIHRLNNEDSIKMLLSNDFISYSKENALFKFNVSSKLVKHADHFLFKRRKELKTLDDFMKIFSEKFK